ISGFEIVGVVLASMPLLTSALDHYAEGVDVMKNTRNYAMLCNISTSLDTSVGIYKDSCYLLLGPLNLPDQQMKDLLLEPKREAWKSPQLQSDLVMRLGSSLTQYMSLINNLYKRILLFFGKKLKLNDDLKACTTTTTMDGTIDEKARNKFFKNNWLKTNGDFDTDKFAAIKMDIDRNIEEISKLTASAVQLEPLRVEKKNRFQAEYWDKLRYHAQRLWNHYIGFLEDQQWTYDVYSDPGYGMPDSNSGMISLEEAISVSTGINDMDNCRYALTLASTVLLLYNTLWLPQTWSAKDIFLPRPRHGNLVVSHFYVSQTFGSTTTTAAAIVEPRSIFRNETVFALGVALLELSYGQPLLSFQTPEDLNEQGMEDSTTEMSIAMRLLNEMSEFVSENYLRVVRRCVHCTFGMSFCDFEYPEFRKKFFEGVVVPLKEEYDASRK
ncbi:hypothetical protein DM02DRAFT_521675, partial [Periconia macrospinosa]